MKTLNPKAAANYLAKKCPDIRNEIMKLSKAQNFAGVMQAVVNYLRTLLADAKLKVIGREIGFVGKVYQRGSDYVKDIIENLFVRSFKGIQKRCTSEEWTYLYPKIPADFRKIYLEQNTTQLKD
ncbi:hypothetical protein H3C65_03940 [Patescibacteria group bacterium]|nr:hypothetical protein [Patescibacteria group bacterium]